MAFVTSKDAYVFATTVLQDSKKKDHDNEPLRRVCDIDYGKFDALAASLAEEEARQKAAKDAEDQAYLCVSLIKERQIYEKPTVEKLKAAERFRALGNDAFQAKNYGLAAVNYRKALLQFDYSFPDTEEETSWMNRAKLATHLNMAACKLHQKEWDEVLTQCRLALELDPQNAKALYRRGLVYLHMDQFEKADEALTSASACAPQDSAIIAARTQLQKKKMAYSIKKRKVFSAMLSGAQPDDAFTTTTTMNTRTPASSQHVENATASPVTKTSSASFSLEHENAIANDGVTMAQHEEQQPTDVVACDQAITAASQDDLVGLEAVTPSPQLFSSHKEKPSTQTKPNELCHPLQHTSVNSDFVDDQPQQELRLDTGACDALRHPSFSTSTNHDVDHERPNGTHNVESHPRTKKRPSSADNALVCDDHSVPTKAAASLAPEAQRRPLNDLVAAESAMAAKKPDTINTMSTRSLSYLVFTVTALLASLNAVVLISIALGVTYPMKRQLPSTAPPGAQPAYAFNWILATEAFTFQVLSLLLMCLGVVVYTTVL